MKTVDRLDQLRARKREIEAEITEERRKLLAGEEPLIGDNYIASIHHHVVIKPIMDRPAASMPVNGAAHVEPTAPEQKASVMTRWLGV